MNTLIIYKPETWIYWYFINRKHEYILYYLEIPISGFHKVDVYSWVLMEVDSCLNMQRDDSEYLSGIPSIYRTLHCKYNLPSELTWFSSYWGKEGYLLDRRIEGYLLDRRIEGYLLDRRIEGYIF